MQPEIRSDDMLPELSSQEAALIPTPLSFDSLLPPAGDLGLSENEVQELAAMERSLIVLGPAAGQVLICPGNQENLTEDKKCPYAAKCPLLRFKKAPENRLCPIERVLVEQRFSSWCQEIEQNSTTLSESARAFVAEMVWIDLQEQRCVNILATGEAARLTQTNITESVNYTDAEGNQQRLPLAWERVLHTNVELLASLHERRRMLMKDWMLTPEMKWKKAKSEGKNKGTDLGSKQAVRGDALRSLDPTYE